MRLWSIHPKYLDAKGLQALWRESLLAQAVLRGATTGYVNHPQLARFQQLKDPSAAIGEYLSFVLDEARARGYRFDSEKILKRAEGLNVSVKSGQITYEFAHLQAKLISRDKKTYEKNAAETQIEPHPLFIVEPDDKPEEWEKVKSA